MSKSQQQFFHQKDLLSTFYNHNRTKSNNLIDKYSIT